MKTKEMIINELLKDFINNYEDGSESGGLTDFKNRLKGFLLEHTFENFNDYTDKREDIISMYFLDELNELLIGKTTKTSYQVVELPRFYECEMPMNIQLFLDLFEGEEYEKYLSRYLFFCYLTNRASGEPHRPWNYAFLEAIYNRFFALEQPSESFQYIKERLFKNYDAIPHFKKEIEKWTSDALTYMLTIDTFDDYLAITPIQNFLNKKDIEDKTKPYVKSRIPTYQYVFSIMGEMNESYLEELHFYQHAK